MAYKHTSPVRDQVTVVPQEGAGSGFLWDEAGHVVTNYHVIERARELKAT